VAGSCAHFHKEVGDFLGFLGDYQLLKEDSTPWRYLFPPLFTKINKYSRALMTL
jgi:hypothetical protein